MRVPVSRINEVKRFLTHPICSKLPLYGSSVRAGFPSPADDYIETHLDLNEYLIQHPAATFLLRVAGDSMLGAGIHPDDILIVDKSLEPTHGKLVIAALDGELTVKRLLKLNGKVQLIAENPAYSPIDITENQELIIWGVVTHVIHQAK